MKVRFQPGGRVFEVPRDLYDEIYKLQNDKERVVSEREDLLASCLHQDKIIKKANDFLVDYFCTMDYTGAEFKLVPEVLGRLARILDDREWKHEFELKEDD
jgi:hypothetical protein